MHRERELSYANSSPGEHQQRSLSLSLSLPHTLQGINKSAERTFLARLRCMTSYMHDLVLLNGTRECKRKSDGGLLLLRWDERIDTVQLLSFSAELVFSCVAIYSKHFELFYLFFFFTSGKYSYSGLDGTELSYGMEDPGMNVGLGGMGGLGNDYHGFFQLRKHKKFFLPSSPAAVEEHTHDTLISLPELAENNKFPWPLVFSLSLLILHSIMETFPD